MGDLNIVNQGEIVFVIAVVVVVAYLFFKLDLFKGGK